MPHLVHRRSTDREHLNLSPLGTHVEGLITSIQSRILILSGLCWSLRFGSVQFWLQISQKQDFLCAIAGPLAGGNLFIHSYLKLYISHCLESLATTPPLHASSVLSKCPGRKSICVCGAPLCPAHRTSQHRRLISPLAKSLHLCQARAQTLTILSEWLREEKGH